MGFDPVAFAMGKAGLGRDVVSALIGGGGVTLETSGWVFSTGTKTTVEGNTVTMASGNTSHNLILRVPAELRESQKFESGDSLILAFTITALSNRLNIFPDELWGATVTIKNGLFKRRSSGGSQVYDDNLLGDEMLTWAFKADTTQIDISPVAGTGSSSSSVSATVEFTGMEFNGNLIFGSV